MRGSSSGATELAEGRVAGGLSIGARRRFMGSASVLAECAGPAIGRVGAGHTARATGPAVDTGEEGFVLLPRRWVVERSFAWTARFRRLARDYERLPETVAGLTFAIFAVLMLVRAIPHLIGS